MIVVTGTALTVLAGGDRLGLAHVGDLRLLAPGDHLARAAALPEQVGDGEQPDDILDQIEELLWPAVVPGGGIRGLELLSLDRYVPQGLTEIEVEPNGDLAPFLAG